MLNEAKGWKVASPSPNSQIDRAIVEVGTDDVLIAIGIHVTDAILRLPPPATLGALKAPLPVPV